MASVREIQNKKGTSYKVEVSNGYTADGKKIRETTTFVPDPTMTKKQQETELETLCRLYGKAEGKEKEILFRIIHKYGADKLEI